MIMAGKMEEEKAKILEKVIEKRDLSLIFIKPS